MDCGGQMYQEHRSDSYGGGEVGSAGTSGPSLPQHADDAESMGELIAALNRRRMYREVTLSLRSGLRDAAAEFSFLRIKGLRNLLKCLHSFAGSDAAIALFCQSQAVSELQVVPVLFRNTLKYPKDEQNVKLDHIFGVEPSRTISPVTDTETALALRVLEGCCLINRQSRDLAQQHDGIKVILNILSTIGALEQGACLDVLLSLMVDSSANQKEFEASGGIERIVELMKDSETNEQTRLKCVEFLLLVLGQADGGVDRSMDTVHEKLSRLVGENCAAVMWAAGHFGSTLGPEQRQTALTIQARRVLEALEKT